MDGKITITGDASSLISMMQKSADAIRGFESQAQGSFGKVQASIGTLHAKVIGLGATILGGAGFKEAIDVSVNLTKEANALGKALGIDATQASILNVALGDIYKSKDDLITANTALTRTLKENEDAFTKLGVKTRDQNGNYRNSLDIMLDVNQRLAQFKEGTDRNIEGMKIYGKQWGEVSGLLKLNADLMEESKKKAAALNLAVGQESIESTSRYRAAMNDVGDVLTAVRKAIGDAVMPALTDLGNEFAETGPQKVEIMRKSMAVLLAAFYGMKNGIEITWLAVKAIIQSFVVGLLTLADTGNRALHFDFAGAREAFANGWAQIKEINQAGGQAIVDASEKNGEAMRRALTRGFGPVQVTGAKPVKDGAGSTGGDKAVKDDSRLRMWEAELEEKKLIEQEKAQAEGRFYQMSKAEEQRYWQDKRRLVEVGTKEEAGVRKKLAEAGLAVLREQYEAEQSGLKLGMEAAKDAYAAREVYMAKYVENARQRFGQESKEYLAALQEQEAMRREHEAKMREIDTIRLANARKNAEAIADEQQRVAQLDFERGLMTREQLLQVQRGFIAEKMRLDLEAADYEIALYKAGTVEYEQAVSRRAEIKRKYDAQLSENAKAVTLEHNKPQSNIFGGMQSSLENATTSMLMKTQTWAQAMKSLYKSVGATFIQELVTKPFAQWAAMWARKLAENLGFLTAENGQQAAAAMTSTAITTEKAGVEIGANAASAGAGAAKAVADIPYVGPVLALAAMASVFAAVSGMKGNVKSAAGGFDIPKGMNPMTQLHEEEMVIPAKYANGLRDIINSGGAGQGTAGPSVVYNDHSGRLTQQDIRRNVKWIADALRDHAKKS